MNRLKLLISSALALTALAPAAHGASASASSSSSSTTAGGAQATVDLVTVGDGSSASASAAATIGAPIEARLAVAPRISLAPRPFARRPLLELDFSSVTLSGVPCSSGEAPLRAA